MFGKLTPILIAIYIGQRWQLGWAEPPNEVSDSDSEEKLSPSATDIKALSDITLAMDNRVGVLSDRTDHMRDELKTLKEMSPSVHFHGVDLNADIVDPEEITKKLQLLQNQLTSANLASKDASIVGVDLSPPIIILEAADETAVEKYLLSKLLSCQQEEQIIQEHYRHQTSDKQETARNPGEQTLQLKPGDSSSNIDSSAAKTPMIETPTQSNTDSSGSKGSP